jgi:hypothetical protein
MVKTPRLQPLDVRVVFDPETGENLRIAAEEADRTIQQQVRHFVKLGLLSLTSRVTQD